jgi:hypothetical protein
MRFPGGVLSLLGVSLNPVSNLDTKTWTRNSVYGGEQNEENTFSNVVNSCCCRHLFFDISPGRRPLSL